MVGIVFYCIIWKVFRAWWKEKNDRCQRNPRLIHIQANIHEASSSAGRSSRAKASCLAREQIPMTAHPHTSRWRRRMSTCPGGRIINLSIALTRQLAAAPFGNREWHVKKALVLLGDPLLLRLKMGISFLFFFFFFLCSSSSSFHARRARESPVVEGWILYPREMPAIVHAAFDAFKLPD